MKEALKIKRKMKYCDVYKETEGEIGSARSEKEQQNITNKRREIRENLNNFLFFLVSLPK